MPVIDRETTWNGEFGMGIWDNKRDVFVAAAPDGYLYCYQYYPDFLGYPEGTAAALRISSGIAEDSDYWLPNALRSNQSEYQVRSKGEEINGRYCHVLERPNKDILWIDVEENSALIKREYYSGEDVIQERMVCSDFQQVGKLTLPFKITREEFDRIDRDPKFHNQVCERKIILMTKASTSKIPEDQFVLPIVLVC